MIRKFECKDCGTRFTSDESEQVQCPRCGSDNVDFAHRRIPLKFICFASCIILIVYALYKLDYSSIFSNEEEIEENDSLNTIENDSQTIAQLNKEISDLGISIPPTIRGIEKVELNENGHYSIKLIVENASSLDYYVAISDVKTNLVIATSKNAFFKNIPFSKNEGKYYAQIISASTEEPLSEKIEITGLYEVKPLSKKLSITELQDLINNQDPSLLGLDNEYLSPVYRLEFLDLPKGSDYVPDNLADVFEMIDYGKWTSVEVKSLEYDDSKHITSITLKINASTRPKYDN